MRMTRTGAQYTAPADLRIAVLPRSASHDRRRIAIVLFDGCDISGASVIADAFSLASGVAASGASPAAYDVKFLSAQGGMIQAGSWLQVSTESFATYKDWVFDAIFVAAVSQHDVSSRLEPLTQWLLREPWSATRITHLGTDASPPPETPFDLPLGIDSARPTAFDAALRTALTLIQRELGDMLTRRIAQKLSIVCRAAVNIALDETGYTPSEKVRLAARWLQDNFRHPIAVADAAAVAGMNGRSFAQHFQRELGVAPSVYLLNLRLHIARQLLVETKLPVDEIARRSGMSSGVHLARNFRLHMKILPSEYRAFHRGDGSRGHRTGHASAAV
ncbi:hypothetical protein BZM26_37595 [Paraburkholderia strydomiana]|nr:hypothetical protein BZM26_37595 [Paraburkholderia strydomiana]